MDRSVSSASYTILEGNLVKIVSAPALVSRTFDGRTTEFRRIKRRQDGLRRFLFDSSSLPNNRPWRCAALRNSWVASRSKDT